MNIHDAGNPLVTLTGEIDACLSLDDLGQAIDRYSDAIEYQIVHFGVSKIENALIRDIVYSRPVVGTKLQVADFSDDVRVKAYNEARALMTPFDITRHKFQTCDTASFDIVRKAASAAGIDGVIVVPYQHDTTISVVVIRCAYEMFLENISEILPAIYTLVAKTFARFPTLAKWPDEYRLTRREAEVLQVSSQGAGEKDAARQLGISIHTVRIHIENAKRKLEARSKTHAIMLATQTGEISAMTNQTRRS